jgi:hypothetical protein
MNTTAPSTAQTELFTKTLRGDDKLRAVRARIAALLRALADGMFTDPYRKNMPTVNKCRSAGDALRRLYDALPACVSGDVETEMLPKPAWIKTPEDYARYLYERWQEIASFAAGGAPVIKSLTRQVDARLRELEYVYRDGDEWLRKKPHPGTVDRKR